MPTYSYACTECGNRFDAVQAFTDDALTTCDQCSGRLRKVFGSVGVVFKGSGFYRTDSRDSRKASTNGSGNGQTKSDTSTGAGDKAGPAEKPAASADKSDKSTPAKSSAAPVAAGSA